MWNKKRRGGVNVTGVWFLCVHGAKPRDHSKVTGHLVEPGPTLIMMTQEQHRHGDIRLCQYKLFNLGRWQKSSIMWKKEKVGLVTLIFHSALNACTK